MGVRFEWYDASVTSMEAHPTGTEVGETEVDGEVAVVLSGDSVVVLEGSFEDVKGILRSALRKLRLMEWDARREALKK